jgi:hypothetical protein
MTKIQIFLDDVLEIEFPLIEETARKLALMAWAIPQHTSKYPEHASILWRKFQLEIDNSLVEDFATHV